MGLLSSSAGLLYDKLQEFCCICLSHFKKKSFSLGHPDSGVVTVLIWTTLTQLVELILERLNLEAWYIYVFSEVEPHYTPLQNEKPVGTHTCAFVCMFACTWYPYFVARSDAFPWPSDRVLCKVHFHTVKVLLQIHVDYTLNFFPYLLCSNTVCAEWRFLTFKKKCTTEPDVLWFETPSCCCFSRDHLWQHRQTVTGKFKMHCNQGFNSWLCAKSFSILSVSTLNISSGVEHILVQNFSWIL